jgi:hypothetical protein
LEATKVQKVQAAPAAPPAPLATSRGIVRERKWTRKFGRFLPETGNHLFFL